MTRRMPGDAISKKSYSAREALTRIKTEQSLTTDAELSDFLRVPLGTLQSWLKRDAIPLDSLIFVRQKTGKSLDWILFGHDRLKVQSCDRGCAIREDALHEAMGVALFNILGAAYEKPEQSDNYIADQTQARRRMCMILTNRVIELYSLMLNVPYRTVDGTPHPPTGQS